jgi:membrane-associated protein
MFDVNAIIEAGGLLLIAAIVFAESGMFVGFFLPGDTLLLSAGIFAAAGKFNILALIAVIATAAIIGDNVGYHIGRRYGRSLFKKEDGIIFRKQYVDHAERFYEKYGSKAMLVAHFVPVVRTFAPPVAGVAHMDYKKFVVYDAIGDIAWATSITLAGYFFGRLVPDLEHYMHYVLYAVIVITLGPTVYHIIKAVIEKRRMDASKATPPHTAKQKE